jgi:hypothetical protein
MEGVPKIRKEILAHDHITPVIRIERRLDKGSLADAAKHVA